MYFWDGPLCLGRMMACVCVCGVCVQESFKNEIMKRQKPSVAQFKKKRKEEEE